MYFKITISNVFVYIHITTVRLFLMSNYSMLKVSAPTVKETVQCKRICNTVIAPFLYNTVNSYIHDISRVTYIAYHKDGN